MSDLGPEVRRRPPLGLFKGRRHPSRVRAVTVIAALALIVLGVALVGS